MCLSFCPQGQGVCADNNQADTPLGKSPLSDTPQADTPWVDTSLVRHPFSTDTPLGRHILPRQTTTAVDGTHPTGMHSCFTGICQSVHRGGLFGRHPPQQPLQWMVHILLECILVSQTSVSLSTEGGCLADTPPGSHCSGRYASYWNAFLFHRHLSVCPQRGVVWQTPLPAATAVDGTHPTGMHSCFTGICQSVHRGGLFGRHPSRQPLQWMVRILLECILVSQASVSLSTEGGCLADTPPGSHCTWRYASYWNAFLFTGKLRGVSESRNFPIKNPIKWPCMVRRAIVHGGV